MRWRTGLKGWELIWKDLWLLCRVGSACWDTSLHNSELMMPSSATDADVIPIHVTICLDNLEPPSYKIEARGSINVVLKNSASLSR